MILAKFLSFKLRNTSEQVEWDDLPENAVTTLMTWNFEHQRRITVMVSDYFIQETIVPTKNVN